MPIEIRVPRLGWSMEEGIFQGWLQPQGHRVSLGDALYSLEGDKAVQDIEAVDRGTLHIPDDGPQTGQTVKVGELLAWILVAGEVPPASRASVDPPTSSSPAAPAPAAPPSAAAIPAAAIPAAAIPTTAAAVEKHDLTPSAATASPAVRRLARELGVELRQVKPEGRITEEDLRAWADARGTHNLQPVRAMSSSGLQSTASTSIDVPRRRRGLPAISPRAARLAGTLGIDWTKLAGTGEGGRIRERDVRASANDRGPVGTTSISARAAAQSQLVALSPRRRMIAARLSESRNTAVPVTLTTRADAAALVDLRQQFKAGVVEGPVPTVTDIVAKLLTAALTRHPEMNVHCLNDQLRLWQPVHLGLAVDTPDGLLVPVLHDAQQMTVRELAVASRQLADEARARRLGADAMADGTFTLSNLGALGVEAFTPVLQPPQIGILGLGRIVREAVIGDDDRVRPGYRLTLSLTFDHRAVDGAPAARFLDTLRRFVEAPAAVLAG